MNRTDLQRLATIRIREAKLLLAAAEYSCAYYLAGYAVECALEACYAKSVMRFDFPEKKNARSVFTHSLIDLVEIVGLKKELTATRRTSENFDSSWNLVSGWPAESRYATWDKVDAEALIDAIARRKDGVLPWTKQRW